MENEIGLIAAGYLFTRIGVLIAFGYLCYRVLRPAPGMVRIETHSEYATERFKAMQLDR